MGRLNIEKSLFNKMILNHLSKKGDLDRLDYDLVDEAIKFAFKQMKLNGSKIVMSGSKAIDIRRVWDIKGISGYVSKYSEVRYLFGPQYEYEPFNSIQV